MKNDLMHPTHSFATRLRRSAIAFVLLLPALLFGRGRKVKPDELVTKHLDSIGTADARAAARNRVILGNAGVVFKVGASGQLSGTGNLMSEGPMIRLGLIFDTAEYSGELFGFDGKNVTVAQLRPGVRSRFGTFIFTYGALLREGLLGGTMSTAWPLLDLARSEPKLQYAGLKTIDGRQLHALKYQSKKGGTELQVTLYLDPESFRHVRTLYKLEVPDSLAPNLLESPQQSVTNYEIVETFDNFKEVDGLTLPHAYRIVFSASGGQRNSFMAEWSFAATKILHNQQIDPNLFVVH